MGVPLRLWYNYLHSLISKESVYCRHIWTYLYVGPSPGKFHNQFYSSPCVYIVYTTLSLVMCAIVNFIMEFLPKKRIKNHLCIVDVITIIAQLSLPHISKKSWMPVCLKICYPILGVQFQIYCISFTSACISVYFVQQSLAKENRLLLHFSGNSIQH